LFARSFRGVHTENLDWRQQLCARGPLSDNNDVLFMRDRRCRGLSGRGQTFCISTSEPFIALRILEPSDPVSDNNYYEPNDRKLMSAATTPATEPFLKKGTDAVKQKSFVATER
jgi:hypothetical protein